MVCWLRPHQIANLLQACRESKWDRLYLLVLMAVSTGARRGELRGLTYNDLDLRRGRAYLHETKNGEQRVLILTSEVIEEVKNLPRPLDGRALLFGRADEPTTPFEYRTAWEKALNTAGITDFNFHDLRHTAASLLASNGASVLEIADVLGHKSHASTKRYSHLCTERKADLVNNILGGLADG